MKPVPPLDALIREVRGEKVILDTDLAALYGVTTKRLNEAVKRNVERFPEDFMFRLTAEEWENLKSQFATSSSETASAEDDQPNRSQIATGSQRHRDPRQRPYAFTEHGALQAANVLRSDRAVAMGVYVIRAFVQLRAQLAATAAIGHRLAEIDHKLLEHDQALVIVWEKLKPLLHEPPPPPPRPKRRLGF
jgi:hypothetical protein